MSLQIELKICRACLMSDTNKLIEADNETLKNFHYLLNTELSSSLLPKTFCEKCLAKIKLASSFKKQSLSSEDYLKSFLQKVNQDFAKSLPNFSENQSNEDEQEIELLLHEESSTAKEAKTEEVPKVEEKAKPRGVEKPKQPAVIRVEKIQEELPESSSNSLTATLTELYHDEEEQHIEEEDSNIFDDKEIYDIMEIDNNYVDEGGNQILNADDEDDDDEGEFILINYKSSDDLSNEKDQQFVVEEMYGSAQEDEKPTRKKHLKRMPREMVERYAQSNDNNQHICTKCVKVFSTRTNLIRHIQSHDGNKPYVCNVCSKGFTQSGSLKQHMYIHSGERPFKCKFCDRAFTQGKTLKFHLRRHMNEKPFICMECSAAFRQRDGLKRHLKARHNVELKYDRTSQMDEKIIAYVNMEQSDEKSGGDEAKGE